MDVRRSGRGGYTSIFITLVDLRGHQGRTPPGVQIISFSSSFRPEKLGLGVGAPPQKRSDIAWLTMATYGLLILATV